MVQAHGLQHRPDRARRNGKNCEVDGIWHVRQSAIAGETLNLSPLRVHRIKGAFEPVTLQKMQYEAAADPAHIVAGAYDCDRARGKQGIEACVWHEILYRLPARSHPASPEGPDPD